MKKGSPMKNTLQKTATSPANNAKITGRKRKHIELTNQTAKELKEELTLKGLSTSGRKQDLRKRLEGALENFGKSPLSKKRKTSPRN